MPENIADRSGAPHPSAVAALTPVAQDYLKVIWTSTEWGDDPATTSMLAHRFGTSSANVTETVRRLASQGLVEYTPYKPVRLTDAGRAAAIVMVRRHRLIETFLVSSLGYAWDEIHDEAERLEHAVSDTLIDRIDAMLGHPVADPHGDPIPAADGSVMLPDRAVRLADAPRGGRVRVVRVSDADPDVLGEARSAGILPGAVLALARGGGPAAAAPGGGGTEAGEEPREGSVTVRTSELSPALAAAVHVVPELSEAQADWEDRYGDVPIWSGDVNATTAEAVTRVLAGGRADAERADTARPRALDIGRGEGADCLWLAQQGFEVTGIDISETAAARAREALAAAGLDDERARIVVGDLAERPALLEELGPFDLITASFFHSRLPMPRIEILRAAAHALADGGHLVIVSHASPPPWSRHHGEGHGPSDLMSPEQEVQELALDPAAFEVVRCESITREATGPDGEHAHLDDGIVVIRRRA